MENEKTNRGLLKSLIKFYKPYRLLFFSDMFFAILGATATLVIPLLIRYIIVNIKDFTPSQSFSMITRLGLIMLLMLVIEGFCNYFIGYYGHVMGAYIERDMRNTIFEHYMKLSFRFFDNEKVGKLLSRVTSDLFEITELLHHGPEDIVISIIKLIGSFIILFLINPIMSAVALIVVVTMLIFCINMNSRMKECFKNNRVKMGEINAQIEDSLSGIRAVKSFNNEGVEMSKFSNNNDKFLENKKLNYKYLGTYFAGMTAFSTLITVASLITGGYLMVKGNLTTTDLITFLLYIGNFTDPIKKIIAFTESFQNGYSGYARFVEIMNIDPDIVDSENAKKVSKLEGNIEFDNVSFKYNDSQDYILENLSLNIDKGAYIAIVGESGAGKSTICSLIPRFYDVTEGCVKIDGINVKDIRLADLRKNIGIVQQDVYIFAGTIAENIRYGNPDATDEEVVLAAKRANAHEFIMNLENGYDTDIGQRGVKLSGGQKQRLSIARVFLKNPPIIILDEATSALDNESERVIQSSFEELAKGRTTLVIAHRLSTIRNAHRILVINQSGIIEDGNHKELIEKDGEYAKLYYA